MATKKTAAKKASTKKASAKAKPGVKKASAKAERKSPVKFDIETVKTALTSLDGPASISRIAAQLGVSTATAKKYIKALGDAVKSEGTTRDRKYTLAS